MKDFLYLKLLDRLRPLFSSIGIDYPGMRRILQLKLVMNGRQTSTVMNQGKSEGKNSFYYSLGMYAFLGLFIGAFMLFDFPLFLKMNIVLGMILFLVLTTMISDFSSVLLDVKDKDILLTRPVSAKTLSAAKLLHILYYLFSMTIAIAGASLIASIYKYGVLFFLTMLIMLILICSFTILFTSILYFAILHLFSGEKLKDIINYFQIALSIFMVVAYQFMGRMFDIIDMNIQVSLHWWSFLLPSSWFAAPFSLFFMNERGLPYLLLALTGVIVPVIALLLYVKVAAPAFERNLQKLTSGNGTKEKLNARSLMRKVSNLICFDHEEKVFFRFTCSMLKNERKLKLRLFPTLTLGVIMPFVMIFSFVSRSASLREALTTIASGKYYLYIYFSLFCFSTLFTVISMSENYKGAWIYRALPVKNPGQVLKGAMKAFVYKYVIAFYLLTCLMFIAICGIRILPDLILIFINLLILMLVIFKLSKKELPFCRDFSATQGGENFAMVILSIFACAGLAGVHYFLTVHLTFGLILNLVISLLLFVILWRSVFRISWGDVLKDAK
ncbi:MAG: hypothetical protein K0Q56_2447 [Sporolactobacillus laevolacticus]|nr:hypothetical protein [Sporolactobacillus laevolacticus]